MTRRARLGTVSSGTLRTGDLLHAFASELESLDADRRYEDLVKAARVVDPESDEAPEVLADLEERLGEHAPPYCYFGTHAGDGADFGYWVDWEAIRSDRRDGTLRAGDALPRDGSTIGQYLHISDHGNAELYLWDAAATRWRSEWGVV